MRKRFRSLIPGAQKSAPATSSSPPAQDPGMMTKLRQFLVGLTISGAQSEEDKQVRGLVLGAAKLARTPGKLKDMIDGIAEAEQRLNDEASTWMTHEDIVHGKSGRFDACDLRCWLAIAETAGVRAIPAREIASLDYTEYSALLGNYTLDTNAPRIARAMKYIVNGLAKAFPALPAALEDETELSESEHEVLVERMFSAMDDVPEGWMVRSHVCGGNTLKVLAGCGVTETFIPEVKFGPDLEIGPGWVRTGNRRRINVEDKRTSALYARNTNVPISFLARPWIVSSRWLEARDPHRAGTPLDIPGTWPAEYRAFVRNGQVTGVSAYYAWAGKIDAPSAKAAIEVRDLAQRIVDAAIAQDLTPRSMDDVRLRGGPHGRALEVMGFADGDFDATIDFIETVNGPLMLEAGPGCGPFGSGHPCGFAGDYQTMDVDFEDGNGTQTLKWMPCEGVAFRTMDHILMMEPQTWKAGDKSNAILSWDQAHALAENATLLA